MACKQSLKLKLLSPCSPLAGARGRGRGLGAGGGGGGWEGNKVNYGKCANGEQELILARPTICAFVSFFLRCIGIICLTLNISVSIFRKFRPSRKISCFKH